MDYTITWQYIVNQMDKKFNIPPNSKQPYAYGELTRYMDEIWNDYFNALYKVDEELQRLKNATYNNDNEQYKNL